MAGQNAIDTFNSSFEQELKKLQQKADSHTKDLYKIIDYLELLYSRMSKDTQNSIRALQQPVRIGHPKGQSALLIERTQDGRFACYVDKSNDIRLMSLDQHEQVMDEFLDWVHQLAKDEIYFSQLYARALALSVV